MGQLTGLPPEILHGIFSLLEPEDLGVLPYICREVRDHVDGNWRLFKDVYLNKFVSHFRITIIQRRQKTYRS